MSKLTKSWLDKKEPQFDSSMLNVGEMMEASITGVIYLKLYTALVDLTTTKFSYSLSKAPKIPGRKLQPGESITLTQE